MSFGEHDEKGNLSQMTIVKQGIVPQPITINWREVPIVENFNSAQHYLQFLTSPEKALEIVDRLIDNYEINNSRPGDILRAAGLFAPSLPSVDRQKVMRDINSKAPISPPLLVKDTKNRRLHIADGYEVICALYYTDKAHYIPCHVTAWDSAEETA